MRKWHEIVVKTPIIGRLVLFVYRTKVGIGYIQKPVVDLLKWLFTSNEITNFTYDLDDTSEMYLASLIAEITENEFELILAYINEVKNDSDLINHISKRTFENDFYNISDLGCEVRFGRRVGWYALVRALKPRIVIETGVDKGLGATLLTAALKKNSQEGYIGRYYGTDINPNAGYLLDGEYAEYGTILFGDSVQSLRNFSGVIDLFINDSDHSADYEAEEYKTIKSKLSKHAVILGDNSHITSKLLEFSLESNRRFVFYQEKPKNHWYGGAGIGISFDKTRIFSD